MREREREMIKQYSMFVYNIIGSENETLFGISIRTNNKKLNTHIFDL